MDEGSWAVTFRGNLFVVVPPFYHLSRVYYSRCFYLKICCILLLRPPHPPHFLIHYSFKTNLIPSWPGRDRNWSDACGAQRSGGRSAGGSSSEARERGTGHSQVPSLEQQLHVSVLLPHHIQPPAAGVYCCFFPLLLSLVCSHNPIFFVSLLYTTIFARWHLHSTDVKELSKHVCISAC